MKRIIIALILLISITSCSDFVEGNSKMNNNVQQYTKTLMGSTYLMTAVTYNNNNYSLEADNITLLSTDSIASIYTFRYNDAHELLRKLDSINTIKLKR